MTKILTIAVDAMGGDGAPKKIIDGIIHHFKKNSNTFYKIFGDQQIINKFILWWSKNMKYIKQKIIYKLNIIIIGFVMSLFKTNKKIKSNHFCQLKKFTKIKYSWKRNYECKLKAY